MSIHPIDSNYVPLDVLITVRETLPDILPIILPSLCFDSIASLTTLSHSLHDRIISIIRSQEQAHIDATFNYLKTKLSAVPTLEEIPHDLSEATSLSAIRNCLVTSIKATVTFLEIFDLALLDPLLNCFQDKEAPPIATEIAALLKEKTKVEAPIDPEALPWMEIVSNSRSGIAVHSKSVKLLHNYKAPRPRAYNGRFWQSPDATELPEYTNWLSSLCRELANKEDFRNALTANKNNDPRPNWIICQIALEKGYSIIARDIVNSIALRSLKSLLVKETSDAAVNVLSNLAQLIQQFPEDLQDAIAPGVLKDIIEILNKKNQFRMAVNFVASISNEEDKLYYLELIVSSAKKKESFLSAIYASSFPISAYPAWSYSFLTKITKDAADRGNFDVAELAVRAITLDEQDAVASWELNDLFLYIAKAAFTQKKLAITLQFFSMISPNRNYSIDLAVREMELKAEKNYDFRSIHFLEGVRVEFGISTLPPALSEADRAAYKEREMSLKELMNIYKRI